MAKTFLLCLLTIFAILGWAVALLLLRADAPPKPPDAVSLMVEQSISDLEKNLSARYK